MFDMSWGEVMVIGAVALIVIGPKDLPRALRTVGNMVGKIRRLAGEFQGQFNEALREAELEDVKRQIQGVNDSVSGLNAGFNPIQTIRDELKGAIDSKPADPAPSASPGYTSPPADMPAASGDAGQRSETPAALSLPPMPETPNPAGSFAPPAEPASRIVVADAPAPAPAAAELAPVRQDEKA